MAFRKELEKFNKLVSKFEKDAMRICKKLEKLSLTLDQDQENFLGNGYSHIYSHKFSDNVLEKAESKLMKPIFGIENLFCEVIKCIFSFKLLTIGGHYLHIER